LTLSLSFGHNSQFKVPNGKFKLNFNICILKNFQWCKQLSVWTKFTHCTFVPKNWNTFKLPIPKLGIHLASSKMCFLFIPSRCLSIFLALVCYWFVSFLLCPNFSHDLRPRSWQLSLWEKGMSCNWPCNSSFELQKTFIIHCIYSLWVLMDKLHEL